MGVSSVSLSAQGDTTPVLIGQTAVHYLLQADTPGICYINATAIGLDGETYTDVVAVRALDAAEMEAFFKNIWAGMKTALLAGDTNGAAGYFLESTREDYRELFEALAPWLTEIAGVMREIELVYIHETRAKYRIMREETVQGQTYDIAYYIYCQKDLDGIWRIDEF